MNTELQMIYPASTPSTELNTMNFMIRNSKMKNQLELAFKEGN